MKPFIVNLRSKLIVFCLLAGLSAGVLSWVGCGASPVVQNKFSATTVVAFGDSLTQGNQDVTNVSYPSTLSSLIGANVANYGISGQTSGQICARMGACVGTVTVVGGQIPTSGTATIQFTNTGYEPGFLAPVGLVVINIAGVVGYTWEAGTYPSYPFQPTTYPTAPVVVTGAVPYTSVLPAGSLKGMVIIWAGRNNWFEPQQVEADITAMVNYVSAQGGTPLVMTILNGELDPYQGLAYYVIGALNQWILNTFPKNSLDIRTQLVAGYDPNLPADVMDHNADTLPFSLRAVDVRGALTSGITTATCSAAPIPVTQVMPADFIMQVGSELIRVDGYGMGTINACDRGFAGTTPASYPAGQIYTGVDSIHLNGVANGNTTCYSQLGISPLSGVPCAGYPLIAYLVYEKLGQMLSQ